MSSHVNNVRFKLQVCTQIRYAPNPESCANSGSHLILNVLEKEVVANQLDMDVMATQCMLKCEEGPNIKLMPDGVIWSHASLKTIPEIITICKKLVNNY